MIRARSVKPRHPLSKKAAIILTRHRPPFAIHAFPRSSQVALDDIIVRTENNASNRKVYQEVIRIDVHVGSAAKMCEESKARATRLSVTIGELRETVARFLSKVKNELESVPTIKDLPEKVRMGRREGGK
jgi:hypothetical protein